MVCPWNCGSRDEDAEHADDALADVLGRERDALRRRGRASRCSCGSPCRRRRAGRSRACRPTPVRDAVDVAAKVLVGRLGPLQDAARCCGAVLAWRARTAPRAPACAPRSATIFFRKSRMPSSCWKVSLLAGDLVVEGDLQALVDVAGDLEALADRAPGRTRSSGRSSGRAGSRSSCRCRAPAPSFFERAGRLALLERPSPTRRRRA